MENQQDATGKKRDEKGRFPKGVSGNPNGRPVGSVSLIGILKSILQEIPEGETRTRAEIFVEETLKRANKGDKIDKKLVWNYIEGLPQQKIDHTSGGKPIPILGGITRSDDVQVHEGDEETEFPS